VTRTLARCLTLLLGTALGAAACGTDSASTSMGDLSPAACLGLEEAQRTGCAGCHGLDFTGGVAPALVGLAGSTVELDDGSTVVADRTYLTESIVAPGAKRVQGATLQMPTVSLSDEQVGQIVDWLLAVGLDAQG
jgi:cytochrome c oxidase subunit 2